MSNYDIDVIPEIYDKYDRSGIYAIKVDNKILYVGQSKNMRKRIKQHISCIIAENPQERKYQILHNAYANNISITFDVLEYTTGKESLKKAEESWIYIMTPPLNTVYLSEDIDTRLS